MSKLFLRAMAPLGMLIAVPVLLTSLTAPARAAGTAVDDPEPVDPQVMLADLSYRNGLQAVFFYSEGAQDYGLAQNGQADRNAPIVFEPMESLLAAYLAITPRSLPVPQLLLAELPPGTPTPPGLVGRTISPGPVTARDLAVPTAPTASLGCNDVYWNSYNWLEGDWNPPMPLAAHTYYSSSFGGMARYSDSFINNCGEPSGARHRIYYKSFGSYHKQFDDTVWLNHWQAVHAGSIHRYRKVAYDAGSGYIRQGRFHN
jgi:hypothetical protein